MMRRKLEAGCFWCDPGKEPFLYFMGVVEVDNSGKFSPLVTVRLGLEVFQSLQEDGRALRGVLTRIAKMEHIPEIIDYEKIP